MRRMNDYERGWSDGYRSEQTGDEHWDPHPGRPAGAHSGWAATSLFQFDKAGPARDPHPSRDSLSYDRGWNDGADACRRGLAPHPPNNTFYEFRAAGLWAVLFVAFVLLVMAFVSGGGLWR